MSKNKRCESTIVEKSTESAFGENDTELVDLTKNAAVEELLHALNNEVDSIEFDYDLEDSETVIKVNGCEVAGPFVLGFLGAYAYDLAIYIGRNLSLLGKKVLVVDRTPDCEAVRIVRAVEDVCSECCVVDFCGMDITPGDVCVGSLECADVPVTSFLDYDVVLMDFKDNVEKDSHLRMCDRVYCVFDMYRHTTDVIRRAEIAPDKEIAFIFRDELPVSSLKSRIKRQVEMSGKTVSGGESFVFHIPFAKEDAVARYVMEEEQLVDDGLASDALREFVGMVCIEVMGNIPVKQYRKQLANAKKQRK